MNPIFKKYFEMFIVISIAVILVHSILYINYFDSLCDKYSWKEEKNYIQAIEKLSTCKDSLICEAIDIKTNGKNEINNWSCNKKDSWFIHINIFNSFKNSLIK